MKYGIYIYEGDLSSPELRENLITDAVGAYCQKHGITCEEIRIIRAEKGKPYICGTERMSTAMCRTAAICGSALWAKRNAASIYSL